MSRMVGLARMFTSAIVPALFLSACGNAQEVGGVPRSSAIGALPQGLADDGRASSQRLYVADFNRNTVTTYEMNGKQTSLTITAGLNGPFGVAVDANGKIYVTNVYSNSVTTYNPDGTRTTPTITVGLDNPYGIAVDEHGKIYVVSSGSSSCEIGKVTTYEPEGIDEPFGIAVGKGRIFVANMFGAPFAGTVTTYRDDGSRPRPTITESIEGPGGVAVDERGKIFVVNTLAASALGDVTSYLPNGTQTKPTITDGVHQPYLIAIH